MTFLPIVERELRTAARQPVTHRMRLIAAGLALAIWFVLAVAGTNLTPSQRAGVIFGTINVLSLGFALLAGVFLTADCLSEERREGTLGLLFLTDLKGHDVVLGKLASTSLHSVYGLLSVVPMLAIPLLMGGLTPGEFMRSAFVLLVTLFLSLSAGMFVSAFSLDSRAAFLRTLGVVVFLSGVLPLLWWGQSVLLRQTWFDFLLWPSPGYALRCAGDTFYSTRLGAGEFWFSVSVISGLGMAFLVSASVLLPRVWQQGRGEAAGGPPKRARPLLAKQHSASRDWLETNPFFWLAMRDDCVGRWASGFMGLALLIWLPCFAAAWPGRPTSAAFSIMMLLTFALHVFLKCLVAVEATRRLSEDRQSGALELLLVTPLPPADVLAGQKAALAHRFRWPRRMLLGMNLLMVWMIWAGQIRWLGPERSLFTIMFAGGLVLLLADCHVIGPLGIWSALTTKRHTRAILKTVRHVLLPSWVALMCFWLFALTARAINSGTLEGLVVLWFVFGLAVDAVVLARTRLLLGNSFRELAATGQSRPVHTVARVVK